MTDYIKEHKRDFYHCLSNIESFTHTSDFTDRNVLYVQLRSSDGDYITNFRLCRYCYKYSNSYIIPYKKVDIPLRIMCRCE